MIDIKVVGNSVELKLSGKPIDVSTETMLAVSCIYSYLCSNSPAVGAGFKSFFASNADDIFIKREPRSSTEIKFGLQYEE